MKTIAVLCCLLYAAWTEGSAIHVVGFEKGEVLFQCSHSFAQGNSKYLCRNPCDSHHDILATVKPGISVSADRITMEDFRNGVFNVTFSQLQLSDSGTYWCGVKRLGFDSFITVHLTVMKATTHDATKIPKNSTKWTFGSISNSKLSTGRNFSTDSNSTDGGEPNTSTGIVLYTTVPAAVTLSILVLVVCFRKCRRHTKPQPQVCSFSTDIVTEDEREADYEIDEEVIPIRTSAIHCPKQNSPPQVSTVAASCSELPIYENLCHLTRAADPKHVAANNQDELNTSDRIYLETFPNMTSDRPGDGCAGKHTYDTVNMPNKPADSHTSNASACLSGPRSDYTEVRPKSLWFGLDLSKTERLTELHGQ